MKKPDRDWLRLVAAFSVAAAVMAALASGQVDLTAFLWWLFAR